MESRDWQGGALALAAIPKASELIPKASELIASSSRGVSGWSTVLLIPKPIRLPLEVSHTRTPSPDNAAASQDHITASRPAEFRAAVATGMTAGVDGWGDYHLACDEHDALSFEVDSRQVVVTTA